MYIYLSNYHLFLKINLKYYIDKEIKLWIVLNCPSQIEKEKKCKLQTCTETNPGYQFILIPIKTYTPFLLNG